MTTKVTPAINSKGKYSLALPWSAIPNMEYTCIAIRSFDDIYKLRKDVYKTYYLPMGLTEGSTTFTATPFSFAAEKEKKPNILTLLGENGSVIYVPDTFLTSQPTTTSVKYSHVVLAISLGALPDTQDLSALKTAISNLVGTSVGVTPTVHETRAPSTNTPNESEHSALEIARLAGISNQTTDRADAIRFQTMMTQVQAKNRALMNILNPPPPPSN